MTKTILGLSGSLRRASFNAGLLRAAADLAPERVRISAAMREISSGSCPIWRAARTTSASRISA